ncbi:MAG: LacI family DNA-binding transcriptional regulator [Salinivirgaceae bacterium]|nr:LacI family DNA-binding transcriptional regulator [Salinivirgaceae bacterium]MDY0279666.1 LacI family DNA-binding transcriptional regulator [Salinivirgaceae bacterium]
MAKKVSISDIAECLGVSKTLVSLVINGKAEQYGINAQTKKRVLDKVEELNYRPNLLAQGFRTGKTNTIGVIVSDIANRFYSRIARKIEDLAWKNGYSVVICSTDENVDKELQQIKLLQERKVDGLIISSSQLDAEFFNTLNDAHFPHVLIDRRFENMTSSSVVIDNQSGAQMAVNHLISQGYRKIGMISITPQHISSIRERVHGFYQAMELAELEVNPLWNIDVPFDNMENEIRNSLQQLHSQHNLPEAFFTLNNNLTSTCLMQLRELSVKIPSDVALIGFDDVLYFDFTNPSITAIEQPVDLISEQAFNLLLKQIKKNEVTKEERSICLPISINIRESTIKR